MKTPTRLSLYGLGLVAAFGAAFLVSGAVVPESAVDAREAQAEGSHGAHSETPEPEAAEPTMPGLSLSADGYRLTAVSTPGTVGEDGELRFSVLDESGAPVLEFTEEHEKELHLIVVREDGSEFRHVHPELDAEGTWSLPWTWNEAGSYRVFADFIPAAADQGLTLTRSVNVSGDFRPVPAVEELRSAQSGEYDVELVGDLTAGGSSTLSVEVTQDGRPVTTMQPYLGAFGHLVALRDGDLAYLHVHPEGAEPEPGELSGPTVEFATEAPTPGRYLLYFDFQIDDEIHSASFVLSTDGDSTGAEVDGGGEVGEPAEGSHDDEHGH